MRDTEKNTQVPPRAATSSASPSATRITTSAAMPPRFASAVHELVSTASSHGLSERDSDSDQPAGMIKMPSAVLLAIGGVCGMALVGLFWGGLCMCGWRMRRRGRKSDAHGGAPPAGGA